MSDDIWYNSYQHWYDNDVFKTQCNVQVGCWDWKRVTGGGGKPNVLNLVTPNALTDFLKKYTFSPLISSISVVGCMWNKNWFVPILNSRWNKNLFENYPEFNEHQIPQDQTSSSSPCLSCQQPKSKYSSAPWLRWRWRRRPQKCRWTTFTICIFFERNHQLFSNLALWGQHLWPGYCDKL